MLVLISASLEYTLANMMLDIVNEEAIDWEKGILHHKEGVDLIPANIELSALEISLINVMSRELILKELIEKLRPLYSYIIIGLRACQLKCVSFLFPLVFKGCPVDCTD